MAVLSDTAQGQILIDTFVKYFNNYYPETPVTSKQVLAAAVRPNYPHDKYLAVLGNLVNVAMEGEVARIDYSMKMMAQASGGRLPSNEDSFIEYIKSNKIPDVWVTLRPAGDVIQDGLGWIVPVLSLIAIGIGVVAIAYVFNTFRSFFK